MFKENTFSPQNFRNENPSFGDNNALMLSRIPLIFDQVWHSSLQMHFTGIRTSPKKPIAVPSVQEYQDDEGVRWVTIEQEIDREGGEIQLPNVELQVPPNSVKHLVTLSVTARDYSSKMAHDIEKTGLQDYLQPGIQLILRPHGHSFSRKVMLELKNVKRPDGAQLLIFHKDVEHDKTTLWTDITEECAPELKGDNVILKIDRFSLLVVVFVVGISLPIAAKYVYGIFNQNPAPCKFHTYFNPSKPTLPLVTRVKLEEDSGSPSCEPGYVKCGENISDIALIDREMLEFYYDSCGESAAERLLELSKCKGNGQRMELPAKYDVKYPPDYIYVRRSEPQQLLCQVSLRYVTNLTKKNQKSGIMQ